jgi:hypothetical protein
MSERLNRLGFGALLEDLSNYDRPEQLQGLANDIKSSANGINNSLMHTLSDRTHPSIGSAATLVDTQPHLSPEGRPKKRMRVFSSLGLRPEQERNLDSRDQMPPPSKPFSRFGSMKKAFNSFRKKDFEGRATSALSFNTGEVVQDAQIHDQGTGNQLGSGYDRPFTRQGIQRSETPRMSGALPTGSVKKSPNRYSVGSITSSKGQFTFRSPIEFTRSSPNNLPNKPSYMHIMDGLGQSNGMDLGLKDPRQNNARPNHPGHQMSGHQMNGHQMSGHQMNGHQMNGHQMNGHQMNGAHQSSIPRENGNFGHPFLHQSPKDPKEIARGHPQPLRSNPVTQADIEMLNQVSTNPVTPTPRRLQKAAAPEDEDSVVSPFFKSSSRFSQSHLPQSRFPHSPARSGVAYPTDRRHPLDACQSLRPAPLRLPQTRSASSWTEGRSLNGLSFFNEPLDRRNQPINDRYVYQKTPAQPSTAPRSLFSSAGRRSVRR